jgi:hypothetical protein
LLGTEEAVSPDEIEAGAVYSSHLRPRHLRYVDSVLRETASVEWTGITLDKMSESDWCFVERLGQCSLQSFAKWATTRWTSTKALYPPPGRVVEVVFHQQATGVPLILACEVPMDAEPPILFWCELLSSGRVLYWREFDARDEEWQIANRWRGFAEGRTISVGVGLGVTLTRLGNGSLGYSHRVKCAFAGCWNYLSGYRTLEYLGRAFRAKSGHLHTPDVEHLCYLCSKHDNPDNWNPP